MSRFWIARGLKIVLLVLLAVTAVSFIVMELWNWLVPAITGWTTIDFWQALGLLGLSWLLFGGPRAWFGGHHGHWRHRMRARSTTESPGRCPRRRSA